MPFLVISFGLYTALGFIQILIGFLVQDRFGFDAERTTLVTGVAFVCAGVGLILSQAVAVPRLRWQPVRYIRVGAMASVIGLLLFIPEWGVVCLLVAMFITGMGIGMATPGFTAGASLAVDPKEQGSVAGLVSATNALALIAAPTAATGLYTVAPMVPIIIAVTMTILVTVFTVLNRNMAGSALPN